MRQQHPFHRDALGPALIAACLAADEPAALALLERGADARFYDPALDVDPLSACARSACLPLLGALLSRCSFDPGESALESALSESLASGFGEGACALIQAGATLDSQGLERAIAGGRLDAINALIQGRHLRPSRRLGPPQPAGEDPAFDLFAPLLDLSLLLSAQLERREIFMALLAAGPSLRGPMAQKTGDWVAAAGWPDAGAALLRAGFRPQGRCLALWRERLGAPLLAFEERQALSRRSRGPKAPRAQRPSRSL